MAAIKVRLAELNANRDAGELEAMVQRVHEDKAAAAAAGIKRAAESSRARKALRARAQQQPNREDSQQQWVDRNTLIRSSSSENKASRTQPEQIETGRPAAAYPPDPPPGLPADELSTACSAGAQQAECDDSMDGWHRVQAKSGRVYFVNSLTQQSQWQAPQQSAMVAHQNGNESQQEPSLAALRWHHAIEAFILAQRHHRLSVQLKRHSGESAT